MSFYIEDTDLGNRLLTVKEASDFLGVTTTHLRKLITSGEIPYVNVAKGTVRKSLRIQLEALRKFLNKGGVIDG